MTTEAVTRERDAARKRVEKIIEPDRDIHADEHTALDIHVAVIARFAPRRTRFYDSAPRMPEAVRRVDADPRLKDLWVRRSRFTKGGRVGKPLPWQWLRNQDSRTVSGQQGQEAEVGQ